MRLRSAAYRVLMRMVPVKMVMNMIVFEFKVNMQVRVFFGKQ